MNFLKTNTLHEKFIVNMTHFKKNHIQICGPSTSLGEGDITQLLCKILEWKGSYRFNSLSFHENGINPFFG